MRYPTYHLNIRYNPICTIHPVVEEGVLCGISSGAAVKVGEAVVRAGERSGLEFCFGVCVSVSVSL